MRTPTAAPNSQDLSMQPNQKRRAHLSVSVCKTVLADVENDVRVLYDGVLDFDL